MTPEQLAQLNELIEFKKNLESSNLIPLNIDQSFRARFGSSPIASTKSASSENQAVNEGGVAQYSVLKPPDAFIQVTISNTVYFIPVYT